MKALYVWLEGQPAGRFVFNDPTTVEFEYATDAPETPVSLSLPRHGGWARKSPWRFLDNLLPDSDDTRHAIAQAVHAPSDDVYGLLSTIGSDVAGGLVFSPTENYPTPHQQPLLEYTADDIAYQIHRLITSPGMWMDPELGTGWFSLAGAQAKFTMARVGQTWFHPTAALPSTHIVKPPIDRVHYADQIENASMRLARLTGVGAPPTEILDVLGQHAYIVERFDRDTSTTPALRIHTEDFAQAAGMPRGQKYGMTAVQAIQLLRRIDPSDLLGYEFINKLAFNTSIGNADAHAKNYSLFLRQDEVNLTPLYDAITTAYWPQFDERLAMSIGGAKRPAEVAPHHWAKLARRSGLNEEMVVSVAQHVADAVIRHADEAYTDLPPHVRDHLHHVLTHSNQHMTTDHQQADVANPNIGGPVEPDADELVNDEPLMLPPPLPNNGAVTVRQHVRNGRIVQSYVRRRT